MADITYTKSEAEMALCVLGELLYFNSQAYELRDMGDGNLPGICLFVEGLREKGGMATFREVARVLGKVLSGAVTELGGEWLGEHRSQSLDMNFVRNVLLRFFYTNQSLHPWPEAWFAACKSVFEDNDKAVTGQ